MPCYTATALGRVTPCHTYLEHFRASYSHYMTMDQYLYIPFLGDEHPFTSYFDVHQGYKVLTHCHIPVPIHINLHSRNARKMPGWSPLVPGKALGVPWCTGVPFMFPASSHLVLHKDHNESFQSTARQRRDVIPHQILWSWRCSM